MSTPNNEFQSTGIYHATDHTNALYVQMVYFVTLNRDPDPSGFAFWVGVANAGGNGLLFQGPAGHAQRIQILGPGTPNQGFIGSPEFQGLFATGYTFTTIDYPGASKTVAYGINSSGQTAGYFFDASGAHGFIDTAGTFTKIDDPSANNYTLAYGINDSGEIVGSFNDATGASHAFIDTGGAFTTIDDPNSVPGNTTAYGINDSGQIVGHFADATGGHGFLYSGDVFTTINYPGAPNNLTAAFGIAVNNIVGYFYYSEPPASLAAGFLDMGGVFTEIVNPNATSGNTYAFGVNAAGQVVGYFNNETGSHGFLYSAGSFTTIDDPDALPGNTFASGINSSGQIVGYFNDASGSHGFLATPAEGQL